MNEYLLDTNVVIGLWKRYSCVVDKLIQDKRIKILREVAEELAVKERKKYKGQEVLSEKFCKLLLFTIEIDKTNIKEFYAMIDIKYSKKGNAYFHDTNKLSENDLLLLYTCYLNDNLILVTEDKYLFNAAENILGKDRIISLNTLIIKEN
ncbi:DUF4411 family protein [Clostridium chromiireducens]|uniref:PIN domain-containing protein n=1 Tax=Clostridium chromiireducens TaxID=225345 RepID=A0A1V4ILP9_9CLOT|nr:DUF4411 family protein [Clostridium chromiireducens]OPJ60823.1 hypothetical protein CLCHR_27930 [Clostridium chromiireducens]RII33201.1 hypothetical protein D2A34_20465 [Clostridium chromiireducens]